MRQKQNQELKYFEFVLLHCSLIPILLKIEYRWIKQIFELKNLHFDELLSTSYSCFCLEKKFQLLKLQNLDGKLRLYHLKLATFLNNSTQSADNQQLMHFFTKSA